MAYRKLGPMMAASLALADAALAQEGPIKVGMILPMSGGSAYVGEGIHAGVDLAVQQVNVRGGVLGRPGGAEPLSAYLTRGAPVPVYGGRRGGAILIGFRCLDRPLNPLRVCHGGVTAAFCDYQGISAQGSRGIFMIRPLPDPVGLALLGDIEAAPDRA